MALRGLLRVMTKNLNIAFYKIKSHCGTSDKKVYAAAMLMSKIDVHLKKLLIEALSKFR